MMWSKNSTPFFLLLSSLTRRSVYSYSSHSDSPQHALKIALQHHQSGRLSEALEYYDIVISQLGRQNTPISVFSNQGAALLALDRSADAENAWKAALDLNPSHAETHLNLAISMQSDNDIDRLEQAKKHAEIALAIQPRYIKAHHALGNALQALGDVSGAYKHWNIADAIVTEESQTISSQNRNSKFQLLPTNIIPPKIGSFIEKAGLKIEALSLPADGQGCLILNIDNYLSKEECEHLKQVASERLQSSYVVGDDSLSGERRSSNTWLPMGRDNVVAGIRQRTARVLDMPLSDFINFSEDLQVVHYNVGDFFELHHDSSTTFQKRKITFLFYLNDVGDGGETHFPLANHTLGKIIDSENIQKNGVRDTLSKEMLAREILQQALSSSSLLSDGQLNSENGVYVTPKQGRAVLFVNLDDEGHPNPAAIHRALPLISGDKWIANFWVREK